MKSLYSYIFEASNEYNIGADFSIQDCIDYMHKNKKIENSLNDVSDIQLKNLLTHLYQYWEQTFTNSPGSIPCRFSAGKSEVKIKREYKMFADQLEEFCKSANIPFERTISKRVENGFILGGKKGLKFIWGDGSLGGNRSKKGLDYEVILKNNIIKFVETISGDHPIKNDQELKNILGDAYATYSNIIPIYLGGGFNKLIDEYVRCKKKEYLDENISLSGKKGVRRNQNSEIVDLKNLEFSTQKVNDVLVDSGEIIADLTIIPDNTYISAKIDAAQLSGISVAEILNNDAIENLINNKENSSDIIVKKVEKFIQNLGIDFNSLIEALRDGTGKLEITDKYDPTKLGGLFQKLVGGNYWYTNPKGSVFVPAIDAKLEFKAEKASISKSGKTLHVKGQLNGLPAEIEYRTDGSGYPYPHRLFPKVDVPKLVDMLKQ